MELEKELSLVQNKIDEVKVALKNTQNAFDKWKNTLTAVTRAESEIWIEDELSSYKNNGRSIKISDNEYLVRSENNFYNILLIRDDKKHFRYTDGYRLDHLALLYFDHAF